ncbi:unnamed protein product [Paramecium pentaurelia]|uniref:Uncharacterized protein n=1 Tax=Paramecium pentaurelia TaxID=43138 RepID=A0A8S1XMW3_9CILI|nr:unnamed protein product [Paramecium pentaurelia]
MPYVLLPTVDWFILVLQRISKDSCTTSTSTVSHMPSYGNCKINQLQYIKLTDDAIKAFKFKSF